MYKGVLFFPNIYIYIAPSYTFTNMAEVFRTHTHTHTHTQTLPTSRLTKRSSCRLMVELCSLGKRVRTLVALIRSQLD